MIKNQVGTLFCEKQHYEAPNAQINRFETNDVVTASVGKMSWGDWGEFSQSRDNTFVE